MAVQEHFEGFDTAPDEMSRSAHKRAAQAIRKLAEDLAALGDQAFSRLEYPDPEVKEALAKARSLRRNSDERRRQLQYAAKLLRTYGHEDLEQQFKALSATAKEDPMAMRLELLREYLIHSGIKGVNAMVELIPSIDRNKLRTLVKRAHDELATTQGERPQARALFQFIKAEVKKSGVEIPDHMQRAKEKEPKPKAASSTDAAASADTAATPAGAAAPQASEPQA